ncbi:MAG: MFS transporter, partial [Rhodospirillales bacterium]
GLTLLGCFAAIYHPVGSAMLVSHADRLGRALGLNGVCGNMGAALAAVVSAALASLAGWQAAFVVPGAVALTVGAAFLWLVPADGATMHAARREETRAQSTAVRPVAMAAAYGLAIIAGGFTFNITTIALPKLIDAQLGGSLPLPVVGALGTLVLVAGALTQLVMGGLIDRVPVHRLFIGLSLLQPIGLGLAASTSGAPMLLGLAVAMAAIYGQVVLNDAMIARYVPPQYRSRAFGLRYCVGFTTSGAAVPLIALMYTAHGPRAVLAVAVIFAAGVVAGAILFTLAGVRRRQQVAAVPAE